MRNSQIRNLIEKKRVRHYEVAEKLNISPYTFSRWLQTELTPERKDKIIKAIESIKV